MHLIAEQLFNQRVQDELSTECLSVTGALTLQSTQLILRIIRMLYMRVSSLDALLRDVLQDSLIDQTLVII